MLAQPAINFPTVFSETGLFGRWARGQSISNPSTIASLASQAEITCNISTPHISHPTNKCAPDLTLPSPCSHFASFNAKRHRYPFLLPNLVGACMALSVLPFVVRLLPETKMGAKGSEPEKTET